MNTYQCEACGETYEKEVSDAEADAEAKEIFGIENASLDPDMAIICDYCFEKLKNSVLD